MSLVFPWTRLAANSWIPLQIGDVETQFSLLKSRVESQDRVSNEIWRSIGGLEQLGDKILQAVGHQGLELMCLEETRCHCGPSSSSLYFTPMIVEDGRNHSQGSSVVYSTSAVGTPSGSRTLSVSTDRIMEAPLENALVLRVPVSFLSWWRWSRLYSYEFVASSSSWDWLSYLHAGGGRGSDRAVAASYG